MNEAGKLIGYVRIPGYIVPDYDKSIESFKKLMEKFEDTTDALVIDQINNPGGSVFYLYALASLLSSEPLKAPRHKMALSQSNIAEAASILPALKAAKDTEEVIKVLGGAKTLNGLPVTYEIGRFLVDFYEFILDQWSQGKRITDPYYLLGADHINPHPGTQYTKPILVVVNELDFSGGDFFSATLQDNQRVTVFGTRTAGAGGYVLQAGFPNLLGIQGVWLTGSIAERVDKNPIENLGVKPDIEYTLTDKDLQEGFKEYKAAINKAITDLVK